MKVFISHSHCDLELAEVLSARLTARGHRVWRDQPAALGQSLSGAIAHAVAASDAYVILVSSHLLESEWSLLEVGGALAQSEEHGKPIIPVLLDRDVEVPALLRDRQYIDLSEPEAREIGLVEIERALQADPESWQRPQDSSQVDLIDAARRYLDDEIEHYTQTRERQERLFRRRLRSAVVLTVLIALSSVALVAFGGEALLSSLFALLGGIAIGVLTVILASISGVLWPSRRIIDLLHRAGGSGSH
jgi:hypothetical protein